MSVSVFIVWDNSRAEHGESPVLVDVYIDEHKANDVAVTLSEDAGYDHHNEDELPPFSVETRELKA